MFLLTDADVEFLLDLGRRWNALIFLVRGYRGDTMALLLPCRLWQRPT